ncbi:hypothetical protein ACOSP7_001192 [Xanthoceras sorbifolium]
MQSFVVVLVLRSGFASSSGLLRSSRNSRASFVVGVHHRRDNRTVAGVGGAQRNNNGAVDRGCRCG